MSGVEKLVIIALGSRFRGDDAVGPMVADQLVGRFEGDSIVEGCDDALAIINAWTDAELAIIVDAAASGAPPGTIHRLEVDATPLPKDMARCSSHGLGLAEAVELGRVLGQLPARLIIYAVEAKTMEPGAALSDEVADAVQQVVRNIEAEITSLANA